MFLHRHHVHWQTGLLLLYASKQASIFIRPINKHMHSGNIAADKY